MTIEHLLSDISNWSLMVPIIVVIIGFNKFTTNTKVLVIVVVLAVIPHLINIVYTENKTIKNLAYNIYTPLEFLCFYLLLISYIKNKFVLLIYKLIGGVYFIISVIFLVNNGLTNRFIDEWTCVNNLIYALWILYIFYGQYSSSETISIDSSTSIFWIMIGLLLYASCSTLYFSVYYYAQQKTFSSLKIIHHLVNTNMYICFAIAIYKDSSKINKKDTILNE